MRLPPILLRMRHILFFRPLFFWSSALTPVRVFGLFGPILLLLGACTTVASTAHSTDRSEQCDYEGQSGICVIFETGAKRVSARALEVVYLQTKREMEKQYGFDLSQLRGPIVHVAKVSTFASVHPITTRLDGDTDGDHGWTDFTSGQITLTGGAVMRHESMHYLLWAAGYSNMLNAVHEHPAFDEYRDGQWLPRRAHASSDTSRNTPAAAMTR